VLRTHEYGGRDAPRTHPRTLGWVGATALALARHPGKGNTRPMKIGLNIAEVNSPRFALAQIGDLAAEHGIAVHALIPRTASLEEAYLDLTGESTDFRAATR